MTPGGRLGAVIELLTALYSQPRPSDALASGYFRQRRYIGSKDRTAIAQRFYGVQRRHARLAWHINSAGGEPTARLMAFADVLLADGLPLAKLLGQLEGDRYAPAMPDANEQAALRAIADRPLTHPDMDEATRLECPAWALDGLKARFGDRLADELTALSHEAPTDMRVNTTRTNRDDALAALAAAGIEASATPLSPIGVRLAGRVPVGHLPLLKSGAVEPQDEGSQLAALLVGAEPGQQVCDFCAGAGGKALALAAMMAGKGRIVASDVSKGRLDRAKQRIKRAGVDNVEPRQLSSARDKWVGRQKGKFDRVLIDAPCSGTGAWRRNPDARWRQVDLDELTALQSEILTSAARLPKPGGRLVYVTCSLLPRENEDRIERLLAETEGYRVVDLTDEWRALTGHDMPEPGPYLRLSPARTGTDGFFVAVLERGGAAA